MGLNFRWFPNSCVWIGTRDKNLVIDPGRRDDNIIGLGVVDLILLTHHHGDHVNRSAVNSLSGDVTKVIGPRKVQRKVSRPLTEVRPADKLAVGDVSIEVVDAYNPPRRFRPTFHRRGDCVGYVIGAEGKRIYHAGDTGLIDEMSGLGNIDLAFIPIGGTFTMDVEQAVEAVMRIKPTIAVPIHTLRSDPREFKARVERSAVSTVKVLLPGEILSL